MANSSNWEARIGELPMAIGSEIAHVGNENWPPESYLSLLEVETDKVGIRTVGLQLPTGLLQTESTVEFLAGISRGLSPEMIAANAAIRLARQRQARIETSYQIHLIDAATLDGLPTEVRRDQARSLLAAFTGHANIRLLPPKSGLPEANYFFVDQGERGTAAYIERNVLGFGPDDVLIAVSNAQDKYLPPDDLAARALNGVVSQLWLEAATDVQSTYEVLSNMAA